MKLTFEQCLELKNAGFPQGRDNVRTEEFVDSFKQSSLDDPALLVGSYYEPTLSELIEACGDRFGSLRRSVLEGAEPAYRVQWVALESAPNTIPMLPYVSTPEEAVAKLWLALKKP